jgi:hypothetical protein
MNPYWLIPIIPLAMFLGAGLWEIIEAWNIRDL